ncbi:MAG: arsenite methyltransferase [Sedimentisphaerales bacterium]
MKKEEIKKIVLEGYRKVARSSSSCAPQGCGCGGGANTAKTISKKIGYSEEDMQDVPEGANLGLGCGNPIALASLRQGETVLDLGSGAGFDCFLAANKVGPAGKVIGVDMTAEMVEKAKENAQKGHYTNVEFRLGEIERLPVDDNSVDVVISNCVINLVPDKSDAFKEAYRVLKPGGRLMVSDVVLLKSLPKSIQNSVEAYIGCLSGAMMKDKYLNVISKAGFKNVKVLEENAFPLDVMANDPTAKAILDTPEVSAEDIKSAENSVASIKVSATK